MHDVMACEDRGLPAEAWGNPDYQAVQVQVSPCLPHA
jgi:hypothetical protein